VALGQVFLCVLEPYAVSIICQHSILIHLLLTLCNFWNQQYRNITHIDHIRIGGDIHAYWISDLSEELTTKLVVAKGREKVTESTTF